MHVEALFTHDASGRIVAVNDASRGLAPRFFLGRTRQGSLWRVRHDVEEEVVRALEVLVANEATGDEILAPPHGAPPYQQLLARSASIQRVEAGPAFHFPATLPEIPAALPITTENRELLQRNFPDWLGDVEACQPFMALLDDGHAVSVCASVRVTPVAHEAGVDTHRDWRGRGYAPRVVAAWARAVRGSGPIPLYSTSWQNSASQAVAAKLGLIRYGATLHFT